MPRKRSGSSMCGMDWKEDDGMLSPKTRTRLIWRDGKKVRASRWIMEQYLGRRLESWEQVHHKNGNPLDNRMGNLEVLSSKTHQRLHKQIYPDKKQCIVCGTEFVVNPRKRARNKCCSLECAMSLRILGRKRQVASSRKLRNMLVEESSQ